VTEPVSWLPHSCSPATMGVSLLAGAPHGHGRGGLAEGPGEAAEGPAPAGSVALAFQPGDGAEADLGLTGQRRPRQAPLAAQLP
jgi:hypothetical protein